jgi:hypothetical protein
MVAEKYGISIYWEVKIIRDIRRRAKRENSFVNLVIFLIYQVITAFFFSHFFLHEKSKNREHNQIKERDVSLPFASGKP